MTTDFTTANQATSTEVSLDELFAQFDELVANRPYLSEDDESSFGELFAGFDKFVANRPYLNEQ